MSRKLWMDALSSREPILGGCDRDGFPFRGCLEAMEVGGQRGAMRTGWNEMVPNGGEG